MDQAIYYNPTGLGGGRGGVMNCAAFIPSAPMWFPVGAVWLHAR